MGSFKILYGDPHFSLQIHILERKLVKDEIKVIKNILPIFKKSAPHKILRMPSSRAEEEDYLM